MSLLKSFVLSVWAAGLVVQLQASPVVVLFNVPGTADPWLANALVDNLGTPEPPDLAPFQSPVFAGPISPGTSITWFATGEVGHPGDPTGPDGGGLISHFIGANNGIADLIAPINGLIGVWAFPGGGIPFFMGANGAAVAPAGTTELFLGVMDGYGWANNIGSFDVTIGFGVGVPDGGASGLFMVISAAALLFAQRAVRARR